MHILIKKTGLILPIVILTMMTAQAKEAVLVDKVTFITEKLMVPIESSQSWQWNDFEELPNPKNYQLEKSPNKYSRNEGDYTLSRDVIGNKAIKVS